MFPLLNLDGRTALIVGGSSGIGLATAKAYVQQGASVIICGNDEAESIQALSEFPEGSKVRQLVFDITSTDGLPDFHDKAIEIYGRVDVLVSIASPPFAPGLVTQLDHRVYADYLRDSVAGVLALINTVAPAMRSRNDGAIILMSSVSATRASSMLGGYGAAKAALNSLVRSLAQELAPHNVRVNAIAPGFVKTKFSENIWGDATALERLLQKIPANRIADPSDIAGLAVLLASNAGAYIHGQTIAIDGGRSIAI